MAGGMKKKTDAVQWQIEVTCDDEWEDLRRLKGLIVVDVYQEWCGPCTAMTNHLKEIKLQLGDDCFHCASARSDNITQLVRFRGRSEPTWLFMAEGDAVAVVKGANVPLIRQTIINELENEHNVMEGKCERQVIPWDTIEFPRPVKKEEVEEEATQGSIRVPDNWLELDGIVLRGSYDKIVEDVRQKMAEHPLEIVDESIGFKEKRILCIIFWISKERDDDEELAPWLQEMLAGLIQEAESKEDEKEEEKAPEEEAEGQADGADAETGQEGQEGQEGSDDGNQEPVIEPNIPIEFQLLFDQSEKEDYISQFTILSTEESISDNEKDGDEDAEEGHEKQHESEEPSSK